MTHPRLRRRQMDAAAEILVYLVSRGDEQYVCDACRRLNDADDGWILDTQTPSGAWRRSTGVHFTVRECLAIRTAARARLAAIQEETAHV